MGGLEYRTPPVHPHGRGDLLRPLRFPQATSGSPPRAWGLDKEQDFPITSLEPCLFDRGAQSGLARGHYFHQDLLVAQKIFSNRPDRHLDVGSRVDGFVAHVAAYRELGVLDIRPQTSPVKNVSFIQADLMEADPGLQACTDSLSCLHAIEHFGLGRYGEPIWPDGHLVAFSNLYRMLKPGGTLYFSVPIGSQRIEFNAHRVFSLEYLRQMFQGLFAVKSFSLVDDEGKLVTDVPWTRQGRQQYRSLWYGCGIFELVRA
jgi:SAM-dependent methyltransferase